MHSFGVRPVSMSDDRIKVCHVLDRLDIGGMENGIVNLCNHHDRSIFEPMICCLKGTGSMVQRLRRDVQVYHMGYSEGKAPLRPLSLAGFFRRIAPTIVHTHAWGNGSLYGILGARLSRVPLVVNGEHGYQRREWVVFKRLLFSMCNANLAVSEDLKKKVVEVQGVPTEKIVVIRNGVDTELFSGNYSKLNVLNELNKEGYAFDEQSFFVISVGSLKAEKGQMTLLKATGELKRRAQLESIKVIFAGDGPDRQLLSAYVEREGLQNDVFFLGNRLDIPKLLSISSILVSTSLGEYEGLSNVIIEANASGVPVIATKYVGTSEIIRDGVNGCFFKGSHVELADKMYFLLKNPDVTEKMSREAKRICRMEFSISKMVKEYENLYQELARNRP